MLVSLKVLCEHIKTGGEAGGQENLAHQKVSAKKKKIHREGLAADPPNLHQPGIAAGPYLHQKQ